MFKMNEDQTYHFSYKDRYGKLTARVVRVEEIEPDLIRGMCYFRGKPRSFKPARISSVSLISEDVNAAMFAQASDIPTVWLNS